MRGLPVFGEQKRRQDTVYITSIGNATGEGDHAGLWSQWLIHFVDW